jgi:hypothetical protein
MDADWRGEEWPQKSTKGTKGEGEINRRWTGMDADKDKTKGRDSQQEQTESCEFSNRLFRPERARCRGENPQPGREEGNYNAANCTVFDTIKSRGNDPPFWVNGKFLLGDA